MLLTGGGVLSPSNFSLTELLFEETFGGGGKWAELFGGGARASTRLPPIALTG